MRVALLSLLEPSGGEPVGPSGYLRIGGQSIARRQLALALALGCSRIVFLAESLSGELVSLQHVAEDHGAQFHVVAAPRALVPLVAPEDELIVLSPGLLAMPEDAMNLLGSGQGVLVMPVETGLAAGFERIDLNHAEAGAMRLPGRVVAQLGDLPGDWNAPSALLRLAMQGGVRQLPLPSTLVETGRWSLVRSEDDAHRAEPRWLRLHTAVKGRRSPGEALAAGIVHGFGPAVLHAGTRSFAVTVGAWVAGLLGLGAAWLGSPTTGFCFLGVSWLIRRCAALLARIERDSLVLAEGWFQPELVFAWALDLGFVLVSGWRSEIPDLPGVPLGSSYFAAAVFVGLLRLVPALAPGEGWAMALTDRLLLAVGLAAASAFAAFDSVLMGASVVLLAAGLFLPRISRHRPANPPLTKSD